MSRKVLYNISTSARHNLLIQRAEKSLGDQCLDLAQARLSVP